ncbi:MAG: hypothetical protein ABIJ48_08615, partial [Actinomycetota bacterium]
ILGGFAVGHLALAGDRPTANSGVRFEASYYADPWLEHVARSGNLFIEVDAGAVEFLGRSADETGYVLDQYRIDLSGAVVAAGHSGVSTEGLTTLRFVRDPAELRDLLTAIDGAKRVVLVVVGFGTPEPGAYLIRQGPGGALESIDWDDADGELAAFQAELTEQALSVPQGLAAMGRAAVGKDYSPAALALLHAVRAAAGVSSPPASDWGAIPAQVRNILPGDAPDSVLAARVELHLIVRFDGQSPVEYGSHLVILRDSQGVLHGFEIAVGPHETTMWVDPRQEVEVVYSTAEEYPTVAARMETILPEDWQADSATPFGIEVLVHLGAHSDVVPSAEVTRVFADRSSYEIAQVALIAEARAYQEQNGG